MLKVQFGFPHGCGDCANFACALPLWIRRGYEVSVRCTPDKAPLFEAVGAKIGGNGLDHPYLHPPLGKPLGLEDDWSGNKCAFNLVQRPMPHIGTWESLWPELIETRISLPEPSTAREIASWLNNLPRPLVALHTQGNTGQSLKNLTHEQERELLCELVDQTDATVLLLDWDSRVFRLNHSRVRHLTDDFRGLNIPELAHVLLACDLVVGIDSGIQHLARALGCEVLGVWRQHFPSHYALPSDTSLHFMLRGNPFASWTKYRRGTWKICENATSGSDMRFMASLVAKYLSSSGHPARETYAWSLLDKCRGAESSLSAYSDRHRSFGRLLSLGLEGVWFQSGCIRAEEDWSGAGFSDVLFGTHLRAIGGRLISVDLNETNCAFARTWTYGLPVSVVCSDSLAFLRSYSGERFSVAYLDSMDADVPGHAEHCLEEAKAVLPHLREDAAILIDDTTFHHGRLHGKGSLAVPYLLENGWRLEYSGYQQLLTRKT